MNSRFVPLLESWKTGMANTSTLLALKVLMILICSGWVSLWLLKPTELWTRKWKVAEAKAMTTVFSYNGLNFAVYTFPIIAVAIVGFVYLELKPWDDRSRRGRCPTTALSNPLIVNSYFGILSSIEILAASLFILFLIWTAYARISNDFHKMTPVGSLELNTWQYKLSRIATRFGLLAEACLALLLLPVLRGMAIFRIVGVQFEASVRYHVWLGTLMICFATLHGAGTLFIWGVKQRIQDQIWQWQKTGRIYLAGEMTLATGLVILITSLPPVRRKKFEIFYYTHHLYIVFLVFFLFHGGDRHFYTVFPGIFLFALDKLLRIIQSRPETCILSARVFPGKIIELTLPKEPRLAYTPTSIIFIKIPNVSKLQWHSFTVASSSSVNEHTMSVMIKCEGWWTNCLYNIIQAELESDTRQMKCIPVVVEGPYGPSSLDFLRYDSLLLIAGGVGITPFLSILREIESFRRRSGGERYPAKIHLIYAVKKSQDLCLLNHISPLLLHQTADPLHLKLKVFVTQEEQSGATISELLNEFSKVEIMEFDTKFSNYATHGPQSSISMAAIVGFSSIVFFVCLICFNRAFLRLHRVKKTYKEKNPSYVVDVLLSSSLALAIICGSLVAILLRWRRLGKDYVPPFTEKLRKEMKPRSRESSGTLEEHEIHFGVRPNFQDIISMFPKETGGSDVGVLVCGPETMKQSVASLCRLNCQGLKTKNKPCFRFHSLTFSL